MKRFAILGALLFLLFGVASCKPRPSVKPNDQQKVDKIKTELTLSGDVNNITGDVALPAKFEDVELTWTSSNVEVISNTGKVTRPKDNNVTVTLTATFTVGKITDSKKFTLIVIKAEVVIQDHSIDLQFNKASDKDIFNLGDVQNMHTVEDGKLILTHTGVTDYPSKGATLKLSTDKYPYLIFFVDELKGNNPKWAAKVHINGSTEDYSVVADTSSTGLVFVDLRNVQEMPISDEVTLELYIYILGEGNSVSFDYIVSAANIPSKVIFDSLDDVELYGGEAVVVNERIKFDSGETETSFNFNMYIASDLAPMLDLFVLSLEEGTKWSLHMGEHTLIENAMRIGAFTIDLTTLANPVIGETEFTIKYQGVIVFDSIANQSYTKVIDNFEYETVEELLKVWDERDAGRLDVGLGAENTARFSQALPEGQAVITRLITTNYSVYPEFIITIDALSEDTVIDVKLGGVTIASDLNTTGNHSVNLIDFYLRDLSTNQLEIVLRYIGSDPFDASNLKYVDIAKIEFAQNEEMSEKALPPKGMKVDAIGGVAEYGFNDNNWVGNARVIARDGKLLIINTDFFSKAEVFARHVDLTEKPFINLKVDELTPATNWVLEIIINPGTEEQTVVRLIGELNALGEFSFDLRNYTDKQTIDNLSYNIFVVGGANKVVTVDYLEQSDVATGLQLGMGDDFSAIENWTIGENMTMTAEEGKATITLVNGGYGKVTKTFLVNTNKTPYLLLNVVSAGHQWKVDPNNLIAQTVETGEVYAGLKHLGSGAIHVTLDIFVIGDDGTTLVLDDLSFVEENPNEEDVVPEIFKGFIPALDISSDYVENQFVITLNSGGYGKVSKAFTVNLDETPYLMIDVASIDGTWKADPNNLIATSAQTGKFYTNLAHLGSGQVTFTLDIFVIGDNGTKLVINDMAFVAEVPAVVPEIFQGFTPALDISHEYVNNQFVVTLNSGGYGKVTKSFTVNLDEMHYLMVDVASIDGSWKVDPSLLAESNEAGKKYIDLSSLGIGEVTFDLDIFVIGGDGTKLVINDMAFVAEIPAAVPEIFQGFTPALDVSHEYINNQFVVTLNSGGYGKVTKSFTVNLDETPYLMIDVASIDGTWKVDPSLLAESNEAGKKYIDLSSLGTGEVTFNLDIFIIGGDGTKLVINDMAFVAEVPAVVPEIFQGFTPALDVTHEYVNNQFVVTLNSGGYGKVSKSFTVNIDETPYLMIDVDSIDGTWKVDPSLLAETNEAGKKYIDLSSLGTGEKTFELDIFVIGGDGTKLVINDMSFSATNE